MSTNSNAAIARCRQPHHARLHQRDVRDLQRHSARPEPTTSPARSMTRCSARGPAASLGAAAPRSCIADVHLGRDQQTGYAPGHVAVVHGHHARPVTIVNNTINGFNSNVAGTFSAAVPEPASLIMLGSAARWAAVDGRLSSQSRVPSPPARSSTSGIASSLSKMRARFHGLAANQSRHWSAGTAQTRRPRPRERGLFIEGSPDRIAPDVSSGLIVECMSVRAKSTSSRGRRAPGFQVRPDLAAMMAELAHHPADLGTTGERLELADQRSPFCPLRQGGEGRDDVFGHTERASPRRDRPP